MAATRRSQQRPRSAALPAAPLQFHSPTAGWRDYWGDVHKVLWGAGLSAKGAPAKHLRAKVARVLSDAIWYCTTAVDLPTSYRQRLRSFIGGGLGSDGEAPQWSHSDALFAIEQRGTTPPHHVFDAASTFLSHQVFEIGTRPGFRRDVQLAALVACGLYAVFDRNGQTLALLPGAAMLVPQDSGTERLHAFLHSIEADERSEDVAGVVAEARSLLAHIARLAGLLRSPGSPKPPTGAQERTALRDLHAAWPNFLLLRDIRAAATVVSRLRGKRWAVESRSEAEERAQAAGIPLTAAGKGWRCPPHVL